MRNLINLPYCHRLVVALLLSGSFPAFAATCFESGWTNDKWQALKAANFVVADKNSRNHLALQLMDCLKSPNADVRDAIGYQALFNWLRENALDDITKITIFNKLVDDLEHNREDPHGVYLPFAALVLSEVVRADYVKSYLSDSHLQRAVDVASKYLAGTRDYRGFDEEQGWRHSVAHAADFVLHLAVNPRLTKEQLDVLWKALDTQIAPIHHFYVFGEPKRLATPVLYIWMAGKHSQEEWETWLDKLTDSKPFESWKQSYKSTVGLARRHNLNNFLLNLYALIQSTENAQLIKLRPSVANALDAMNQ